MYLKSILSLFVYVQLYEASACWVRVSCTPALVLGHLDLLSSWFLAQVHGVSQELEFSMGLRLLKYISAFESLCLQSEYNLYTASYSHLPEQRSIGLD